MSRASRRTALLQLLALVLTAGALWAQNSANVLVIRAGRMFSPKSDTLLKDQVVVINGDRIVDVGNRDRVQIPSGAEIIDLSNATVLPGLIDTHTHLFFYMSPTDSYRGIESSETHAQLFSPFVDQLFESLQYRTIMAVANAKLDLEAGFTTERDLGNEGAIYSDVDVRNAINAGIVPGPRLQVATRGIVSTTGNFHFDCCGLSTAAQVVDSPDAARQAVREQVKNGADLIKIFASRREYFSPDGKPMIVPTLTLDETRAAVDEAHREFVKVACHAYGNESVHNCVEAGADSIEHGNILTADEMRTMIQKGIYYVPTMYVFSRPTALFGGQWGRLQQLTFRNALSSGVKVAFGSDVGPFPHGQQAIEFEYLVKYGMKPAEALRSATSVASELMGWQDQVGSIEKGKFADIVAVAGDPLSDITETKRVKFVMKGGEVIRNDFSKGIQLTGRVVR